MRGRLPPAEAEAIRERIMTEMIALEEERVERMMEKVGDVGMLGGGENGKTAEDEGIVRRELNKADPSGEFRFPLLLLSFLSPRLETRAESPSFFQLLCSRNPGRRRKRGYGLLRLGVISRLGT